MVRRNDDVFRMSRQKDSPQNVTRRTHRRMMMPTPIDRQWRRLLKDKRNSSPVQVTTMQRLTKYPHVTSAAAAILWVTWERQNRDEDEKDTAISMTRHSSSLPIASASSLLSSSLFPVSTTLCEARISEKKIPTPSRFRRTLAALLFYPLPMPRRLVKNDPVFSDAQLKRGLRQRARDESKLRALQEQVVKAVAEKRETECIRSLHDRFCTIAYGEGVTPQMREDFVIVSVSYLREVCVQCC